MNHSAGYTLTDSLGTIILIPSSEGEGDLYRYNGATIEVTGTLVSQPNQRTLYMEKWVPLQAFGAEGWPTVSGAQSTLVILFQWNNLAGTHTVSYFQSLVTGASGSMNAYFVEDSYNTITVTGGPTSQWYTLGHPSTYYYVNTWDSCGPSGDYTELTHDILDLVDPYIDFSLYVGTNKHILFVGADSYVWGCALTWGTGFLHDGVYIKHAAYISEGEPLSTYLHEFSHDMGLPDLYDYTSPYDPYNFIDSWDLMSIDNAQHHSSWCKIQLGWITSSRIRTFSSGTDTQRINRIEYTTTGYHTFKIHTSGMPANIYYLVETRQKTGFDINIPASAPDHGVLITKIDESLGSGAGIVREVDHNPTTQQNYDGDAVWDAGDTYTNAAYGFQVIIGSWDGYGFSITVTTGGITVTFKTNPTSFVGSAGTITFSGSTYSNGQTGTYASGDYSATANVPTDYQFLWWEYSGSSGSGVYVPNIGVNPTTVQVRGTGWLKAVYTAKVTFYTDPSSQGSISWGSCSNPGKTNGQTIYDGNLPPEFGNSIPVCANTPSGYTFSGWSCSGGLSCSGSNPTTTATFTGPGSITASFSAVGTDDAEITSNDIPTSMTAGQSYTVHVTVQNTGSNTWTRADGYKLGSPGDSDPFAFPRVELDSSASVGSGQTYTFTFTMTAPSSAGSYTTDWRMLREGVAWFGDTLTKTVTVTPTTDYVLHVHSGPMTGVGITWVAGTGSQTGYTNFDIGPYTAGFTVTLTAPNTYGGYTLSRWTLDGSNMGSNPSLSVVVDDSHRERTAIAVYSAGSFGQTVTTVFSGSDTVGFMMTGTLVDDSAMGFIYAHRGAPKVLFTKTDTSRVQSSGQPTWVDYTHLVTVGGPGANPTTKYYEDQGLAPLRYAGTSTQAIIMYGSEVKLNVPLSSINSGNDYFVMEVLADGSHKVIMLWGVGGWGTYASGVYFDGKFTDMASLTDGWYIIHWQDLNGNGVPDYPAEFTIVASGS